MYLVAFETPKTAVIHIALDKVVRRKVSVALLAALNIERRRHLDLVLPYKAALVHREAQTSTRVNVEERLSWRDIAEGLHKRNLQWFARQLESNRLAERVAELSKVLARDVRDEIAEGSIRSDHRG